MDSYNCNYNYKYHYTTLHYYYNYKYTYIQEYRTRQWRKFQKSETYRRGWLL